MGRNLSIKKVLLKRSIFVLSFLLLFLMSTPVYAENTEKRVLVINSYQQGFSWTDQQSEAIVRALEESGVNVAYNVEYLDWKQHPNADSLVLQKEVYKYKYSQWVPDVVITTDDAALGFALKNRQELFPEVPSVFSGILKDNTQVLYGSDKEVVGVYEAVDPEGTLKLAMNINPEAKEIYVITDNTESGIGSAENIKQAVEKLYPQLKPFYLNNLTMEELQKKLSELNSKSIVVAGSYSVDAAGFSASPEKLMELMSQNSAVPIYDLYEFRMNHGALGGSVLSGGLQGEAAAGLAIRLLNGEAVSSLENIDHKTVLTVFDYNQLEKYHIPLNKIPKDGTIINRPFSFFKTYWYILAVAAVIFTLMIIHIAMLSLSISRRKRAEAELINKNKEITEVYEELAASDEELFAQLEELTESQEKLSLSEQRYKLVVEASNDVIWDWDLKSGQRIFTNKWYEILGYNSEEILTADQWNKLIHPADMEKVLQTLQEHLDGKSLFYSSEYRIRRANGEYRWILAKGKALLDKSHKPYRMIGAYTDITELKENEEKIWRMAYFDSLTELPNRSYLNEYVNEQINGDKNKKNRLALMYIDVDNFKLINDTYGHSEGDNLLKEIGQRIHSIAKNHNKIFRIGGDEFVVIQKNYQDKAQIEQFATSLMESLKAPILLHENVIHASVSAGIVFYPEDGQTFEELFKNVDAAMYYVKENGKRGYGFFDKKMNEALLEKMNMEKSMRKAIDNNEFVLFYQPQTSAEDGEIQGFEALIRWFSPELGMVSPGRFIRIAEETGLIIPIGEWVLRTACSFAAALQKEHGDSKFMSINLSTLQLRQHDFVDKVIGIMKETGVNPSTIHLEITETILMDSFENNIAKLNQLKAFGVHISLDDFGTGYSSLTYLRKLPINTLKIDKSFVDDILTDEGNKRIINSMIQLAHGLGLMVVAEGVEEEEQYLYLKNSKCDMIQGYYISKPVGEADVAGLLNKVS